MIKDDSTDISEEKVLVGPGVPPLSAEIGEVASAIANVFEYGCGGCRPYVRIGVRTRGGHFCYHRHRCEEDGHCVGENVRTCPCLHGMEAQYSVNNSRNVQQYLLGVEFQARKETL